MEPLFYQLEFEYPEGDLFYDRSGRIARLLRELYPDLTVKSTTYHQREFTAPSLDFDIVYGPILARVSGVTSEVSSFAQHAQRFFELIVKQLALKTIGRFSYTCIMGHICATKEQAAELMWPVVGEEMRNKMADIAPAQFWRSVQGEFETGPLSFESRVGVMDLFPNRDRSEIDALASALQKVELPEVQFIGASLEEAAEYFNIKAGELIEGGGRRCRFIVDPKLAGHTAQVTLDLKQVPFIEAIRYLTELCGVKFKIGPAAVLIVPLNESDHLPYVTFHLVASGREPIPATDLDAQAFIENFRSSHFDSVFTKLAPHIFPNVPDPN